MAVVIAEIRQNGETLGALTAPEHAFKTGSKGYYGLGKITIAGRRYQASISLVEIHSKPSAEQAEDTSGGSAEV